MSRYLVTGYTGFIGYHLTKRLLEEGHEVVGVDNFNDYYDSRLKQYRHNKLKKWVLDGSLWWVDADICNLQTWLYIPLDVDAIYHLAAIPGVRKSIEDPYKYIHNNIVGSITVLRQGGEHGIKKVILASSSSIYGEGAMNKSPSMVDPIPCSESDKTDRPSSPYAMTKIAMELAGYTYQQLYGYDVIIPRFFTVYGPAGRPDMAYFKFIQRLMNGKSIDVYGDGKQLRDFTYIDDIIDGLLALRDIEGYEIINLGSGNPLSLNTLINCIMYHLAKKSIEVNNVESQAGDVWATYADINKAGTLLSWIPQWSLEDGIHKTVNWFKSEYEILKNDHGIMFD